MTNNRISNFSDEPIIDDELHKNIISVLKKQDLHISQQHFNKILAHFAPSSKVIIKSTSHDILGQEKVSNASVNIDNNNINEMKKLIRYIPDFQPLFKMYITLYELQKILHDYPKFQKKIINLLKDESLFPEDRNDLAKMIYEIIVENNSLS